ncbi:MAG: hypothetical protein N4A61_09605 [Pelagimonas sp.]|jgi:hypothetical protein|nr:hypothetical protein [Pelagimonas sp.]
MIRSQNGACVPRIRHTTGAKATQPSKTDASAARPPASAPVRERAAKATRLKAS